MAPDSLQRGRRVDADQDSSIRLTLSTESSAGRIDFRIDLRNGSAADLYDVMLQAPVPAGCILVAHPEGGDAGEGPMRAGDMVQWAAGTVRSGTTAGPFFYSIDTRGASTSAFFVQAEAAWGGAVPGRVSSRTVIACPLATYPYLKKKTVARNGMVSSLDPRASAIGVEVLKSGGNAVDAAIATAFAVGVVEPNMSGIGGKGGFMLLYSSETGRVHAIDFNARAPRRATPEMFLDESGQVRKGANESGYLAVCVPSTVAGYAMAISRFGRMDWRDVVEPACRIAETGYQVSEALHRHMVKERTLLARFPSTARVYLRDGRPYETGEWLRPRDLAATYLRIAEEGPEAFYRGEIARAVEAEMARHGGLLTMDDLAGYRATEGETISTTYHGLGVFTYGVNTGGSATLANLNLLENLALGALQPGSAETIHLLAEAIKLTFADRFEYLGDPDYVKLPLRGMISKDYARERAQLIRPDRAARFGPGDPWAFSDRDTTHISVVDDKRNMVSLTTSNGPDWGSGVVVEGSGILLNGGMNRFDPRPGRPNSVQSWKRPLRNSNPILLLKAGKPYMTLGCPGGERQISSIASVLVNHLDFGMELQDAIDAPRFHTEGRELIVQARVPGDVQRQLEELGHELVIVEEYARLARVHGVMIDESSGELHGGADPAACGAAVGY